MRALDARAAVLPASASRSARLFHESENLGRSARITPIARPEVAISAHTRPNGLGEKRHVLIRDMAPDVTADLDGAIRRQRPAAIRADSTFTCAPPTAQHRGRGLKRPDPGSPGTVKRKMITRRIPPPDDRLTQASRSRDHRQATGPRTAESAWAGSSGRTVRRSGRPSTRRRLRRHGEGQTRPSALEDRPSASRSAWSGAR